ncbi:cobalamin-5'-phosphate synthase [Sphingomonas palmae]|uniref:Adenosylcobinamide-GDP ribazoletransferase n=1 Tax=Sphingomonas palmae TaxID=1855283 RepID=A0A1H7GND8_9SPHN|nr:adenosylcobinamide-GDP ribazoletransferase [Sphingomonas palmae]SEK39673.1 cobalamin-5'-phosphate synthase [Sphingomonas palmae]
MRRLIVALSFLTRLPMPRLASRDGDFAAAVRMYPLVGLVVGAVVAAAAWSGALIDPWMGALAALLAWTWVTGALHLDGLGDLADGLGAAHGDRTRLLSVMADPHVGSFGVIAIVLQLAAKLVALHLIVPAGWTALLLIPAAARVGPLWWARAVPLLKNGGLGAAIAGAVRSRDLIGWGLLLLGGSVVAPVLLAAPVVLVLLGLMFTRRVGGMSGDVHGAGIELTETALLLMLVIAQRV